MTGIFTSLATIFGSPICIEKGYFFSISCLIVCPEMATDATLDFFILLFIIALLIALENKYPISLLSLPRSVKEILFNSITVLIFSFNRVGIFDE